MGKYVIVPAGKEFANITAEDPAAALAAFAAGMDSDMGAYFRAVPEEELPAIRAEEDLEAHKRRVISFMRDELEWNFDVPASVSEDVAEDAYGIYCQGNGETEYECIEKAHEAWQASMKYWDVYFRVDGDCKDGYSVFVEAVDEDGAIQAVRDGKLYESEEDMDGDVTVTLITKEQYIAATA